MVFVANLDSPNEIKTLDSKNLTSSIEQLDKQCQQVFEEVSKISFDEKLLSVQKVVVIGMGGSTLGADIVRSAYFSDLKVPLEYVNGYHVPGYVDSKTLVILSSYSGTTEEVLAAYQEAKKTGAMILAIASGGDLAKFVESGEITGYIFEPKFNPSGQPRMGLGYSVLSQVLILTKLGFLNFTQDDLEKILKVIDQVNSDSKIEIQETANSAKKLARKFLSKIPLLFASEHLVGNIHTFANQLNENAKVISAYFSLPEANHHLIEGLSSTDGIRKEVIFFFLKSNLYSPRVLKRYDITRNLVEKSGYQVVVYEPLSGSGLEQVFEFLTFGSWVSFYLAILYGRDPSPIPNVDSLKAEMAKE